MVDAQVQFNIGFNIYLTSMKKYLLKDINSF